MRCTAQCTIDTSACEGCGNGRIDSGEVCDGTSLGTGSCPQGGVLACGPTCLWFDTTGCFACGNGRREGTEECDGRDQGGAVCNAPGETGGDLSCGLDCRRDRSTCWRCGNARVDPGEQCDDGNLQPGDGCGPACRLECGNGAVESNEECDDGNATPGDGCHLCGLEAVYAGGGGQLRECAVHWGMSGPPAPAASVTCADGNAQCDQGSTANECTFRVFHCFNRADFVGGGPPPCTPTNIARVELTGASLTGPAALGIAGQDAVLSALSATLSGGGSAVTRTGVRLDLAPPMSAARRCGTILLPVPKGQERTLSLRATTSAGSNDDDLLTFRCQ